MRRLRTLTIPAIIVSIALILVASSPWQKPEIEYEAGITTAPPRLGQSLPVPQAEPRAMPETFKTATLAPLKVKSEQTPAFAERIVLQGRVSNASGEGLADIEVEIENRGFDGEPIATMRSDSDDRGEFTVAGLVPGRQYKLAIRPQQAYAGHSLDSFTVDQSNSLPPIVLNRIDLADADGMIVDTSHAPIADFELTVRSLAVEFPDRVIRSDSSGYFNLRSFPAGELRIATNASDYYQIRGLELRPDEYRNLTLVIDRGNYHLSGWVSDDNGAPLAQAKVTLKSAFAIGDYHSFAYRSKVTDDNGTFEFSQLGGHPLTLGVYANGFETHIRQYSFESFSDTLEIRLQRQG